MSYTIWTQDAVLSEAHLWQGPIWRMVEAQHIASTMKLVDTLAEQDVLETLLESSKPRQPDTTQGLDYLLATPFRYYPQRTGSRFRAITDPGVFYGAQTEKTAAAELGYWRWRFLKEASQLKKLDPVAHTAFQANISTAAIDLRVAPFNSDQPVWQHPNDYSCTQAFARTARAGGVGAIFYHSVRDPDAGVCIALLTPAGFAQKKSMGEQTWFLAVSQNGVIWKDTQSRVHSFLLA